MAEIVVFERQGPAAILTFNRPDKLNAITSEMLAELDGRLGDVERDNEVRAVVLTGMGRKAFVAGADIGEYAAGDHDTFVRYQFESRRIFSRIDEFPKPVIAAVNGYALGGGFEIALCCDVIVASGTATFGLPEATLGLSPGGGGTQRLTRSAGPFVAADVLLSARRLTAEDALRLGLAADVVEPERLLDTAVAKALAIASMAPIAAREMLGLIRTAMTVPLEEGLDAEHQALFRLHRTGDAREGIRAFLEKRKPLFTGE